MRRVVMAELPELGPKRGRRLYVYLTVEEREELRTAAREMKTTESSLARAYIIKGLRAPSTTKEIE